MPPTWIEIHGKRLKVELPHEARPAAVDGVAWDVSLTRPQPGTVSLLHTQPEGSAHSYTAMLDRTPDGDFLLLQGPGNEVERIPVALYDPRSLKTTLSSTSEAGARPLKAPMPGRIPRVLVAQGETVEVGQPCLVIEAMKMQNELKAPKSGTVQRLAVTPGDTVTAGHILLVIE